MERENENKITEIIRELIEKMGFNCEIESKEEVEDGKEAQVFNVKTEDSSFLIGQHGVNLHALQHIARLLVRKELPEKKQFSLDVNGYRQEKNQSLIQLAKAMAEQAIGEKRAVALRPMSAYERRIIHLELAENDQIKTESIGEGEDRRVVISPLNLI